MASIVSRWRACRGNLRYVGEGEKALTVHKRAVQDNTAPAYAHTTQAFVLVYLIALHHSAQLLLPAFMLHFKFISSILETDFASTNEHTDNR